MVRTYITQLLGSCPSGYEALEYLISGIVLIFLCSMAYRLLFSICGIRK